MDMTAAITPKSDQINADDLIAGPRTFTIESVTPGSDQQPVNIHLVESPKKPYRPGKSMGRVLTAAWKKDTDAYVGKRLTLYRDPDIKFGDMKVGGIRISHMSGIDKPMLIALTETRGKKVPFTVKPLTEAAAPKPPTSAQIASCATPDELMALWESSTKDDDTRALIKARKAELDTTTQGTLDQGGAE